MALVKITTPACPMCGKTATFTVSEEALNAYHNGALVQNAFPEMSADDRERLISGMCPACWKSIFG